MGTNNRKAHLISAMLMFMLLIGSVSSAFGRDFSFPVVKSEQTPTSQVVARVYYQTRDNLEHLAVFLDIWEVNQEEGYLVALLTPTHYARFEQSGYLIIIDQEQTQLLNQPNTALSGQSTESIPSYACYRTVEETYSTLTSLAINYPQLAELIDIVACSTDLGVHKPDPAIYSQALSQAGLSPDESAFVGHLDIELQGAHTAGMITIAIDPNLEEKADYCCRSLPELLTIPFLQHSG